MDKIRHKGPGMDADGQPVIPPMGFDPALCRDSWARFHPESLPDEEKVQLIAKTLSTIQSEDAKRKVEAEIEKLHGGGRPRAL